MEVIPVIEIRSGKSVRATSTRSDQPNVMRDDVLLIAHRWKNEGAARLHIHDVDGARVGMPQNRDQVRDIIRRVGLSVQFSGGVRSVEVMERVLSWGVDRVIADADSTDDLMIKASLPRLAARAALDIRVFQEKAPRPSAPAGAWLDVYEFIKHLNMMQGWPRFIYRQILGDGTLTAPDIETITKVIAAARRPVGVFAKVRNLDEMRQITTAGAEALLIGEAIYDGTLNLPEMLAAARSFKVAAASPPGPQLPPGVRAPIAGAGRPQQSPYPMPGQYSPPRPGPPPPRPPGQRPPMPPFPPRKDGR